MGIEMFLLGGALFVSAMANVFLWRQKFDAEQTVEWKDHALGMMHIELANLRAIINREKK